MSDSQKKTIQIIPEHFRVQSSAKTRKKREPGSENPPKLRVKNDKPKMNKSTKNQVLKYIRQQQEQKYKRLLENESKTSVVPSGGSDASPIRVPSVINEFDSDFKQSLEFLNTISENTKMSIQPKNQTLKNYSYDPGSHASNMDVYTSLPNVFDEVNTQLPSAPINIPHTQSTNQYQGGVHAPQYGCLKGGALPTYRMWKNKTQRNVQVITGDGQKNYVPSVSQPMFNAGNGNIESYETEIMGGNMGGNANSTQNTLLEKFKSPSFMKKKQEIQSHLKKKEELKSQKQMPAFRRRKQKRTMRRTFRLGKSKHYPRVSVLVSNRTLRKQISSRCQELKQVPLDEVKKTLIKKGFIKVGSTAPNDVLRKMYESISLICGDIQNHNPDNLVYNYFNDAEAKHT